MDMMQIYQSLFWYMFLFYLGGFASYTLYFMLKKDKLNKIGLSLFSIGFVLQAVAFGIKRWIVGAIRFQNMFEHISLMSWTGVAIMIYVIFRYKNAVVGVIIAPIIVMLNAAAALLDKNPAENLMPALQSNWLTIHISLAALGSGAFVVAGAVSLLYLFKNHEYAPKNKTQRNEFFQQALIFLVFVPMGLFFVLKILGLTPEHTAFQFGVYETQVAFQNALGQFVITMGLLFIPILGVFGYLFANQFRGKFSKGYGGVMFAIYILALVIGALVIGWFAYSGKLIITPVRHAGGFWRFFEFVGAAHIVAVGVFVVLYFLIYEMAGEKINRLAGNLDLFDEINYRAVSLGYPLYTVGALFAGAIWAEQAWGTFWGWDPKEVGALLVWLFYSAVLHARYNKDWRGSKLAILSIIGTIMIFVTFYGNYFFGGLHAYA